MTNKTTRVALYTRVSTEDQVKDGHSLAAQLARLRRVAEFNGWEVVAEYSDEGRSGRDIKKRPGYRAMMANRANWDRLLMMKLDRGHRNLRNYLEMGEILESEGKDIYLDREKVDTSSAFGRFFFRLMAMVAEFESDLTSERIKTVIEHTAQTTTRINARPCYGYDLRGGERHVNPEEAKHVKMITRQVMAGHHPSAIARILNERGIEGKNGGRNWKAGNIAVMLGHPELAGARIQEPRPVLKAHEPILSVEEFIAVHYMLDKLLRPMNRGKVPRREADFQRFMALVGAERFR